MSLTKASNYQKPKIYIKKFKFNLFCMRRSPLEVLNGADTFLAALCTNGQEERCFVGETKILMGDNTYKEIQNIKVGDSVVSYNVNESIPVKNKVVKKFIHPETNRQFFIINGLVKVTGNHLVFANGTTWLRVENLQTGDTLLDPKGRNIKIKKIERIAGIYTVYNIHLDGDEHNYFAQNLLAHNFKPSG